MKFTGFYEVNSHSESQVVTTIRYIEADELLERIRVRLADVEPGAHVRIDLIAWGGEQ